jgi:MFS family permease
VPAADALTPARDPGRPDTSGSNYRLVALIVASALFMEFVDATVLATALPTMARDFGVRPPEMSIALILPARARGVHPGFGPSGRPLWLAHGVPFGHRTVRGRKPGLRSGAHARRHGAGALPPGHGRGDDDPGRAARPAALGGQAGHGQRDVLAARPALVGRSWAPLGGFIVTYLDWRWIFYINLPVGVLGFCLVSRFIANFREDHTPRFDAAASC